MIQFQEGSLKFNFIKTFHHFHTWKIVFQQIGLQGK